MTTIQDILDRYWDAETTVVEEDQLRAYFASAGVAPEHAAYAGLFTYQSSLRSMRSQRALPDLGQRGDHRSDTVVTPMRSWRRLASVAAAALVLLTAGWVVMDRINDGSTDQLAHVTILDDVTDPAEAEEAMQVTREALAYLTAKLDKNSRTVKTHVKTMQKADIFNKY